MDTNLIVAIVQARMRSTRLPGKVLLPVGDAPILSWVVDRTQMAALLDVVVVATTTDDFAMIQSLTTVCHLATRSSAATRRMFWTDTTKRHEHTAPARSFGSRQTAHLSIQP